MASVSFVASIPEVGVLIGLPAAARPRSDLGRRWSSPMVITKALPRSAADVARNRSSTLLTKSPAFDRVLLESGEVLAACVPSESQVPVTKYVIIHIVVSHPLSLF